MDANFKIFLNKKGNSMRKLYNIYYIDTTYGHDPQFEVTTDNFERWLKDHNESRIADGNVPEKADCFHIQEIHPILYNKNKKGK